MSILLPLLLAGASVPVALLAGAIKRGWTARAGALMAALAFGTTAWGWQRGGGSVVIPWAPSWGLYLAFTLDGLATLFILLATGIGGAVLIFSSGYLPHHLEEENRPPGDAQPFYGALLLFMASMVGLATAQDLILLFVFWDLTAVTSYYLIGYDRHHEEAREAALMALLVTGISAVFLLLGSLLLATAYGTFSIPEVLAQVAPGPVTTLAGALVLVAALAKSAQVPVHFWLPRAMAAPTPVSAYLHSAAMVAAGVFLVSRLYPLLQQTSWLLDVLLWGGSLSMLLGGLHALTEKELKRILAYSTIAQYGYIAFLLGLGGPDGVAGAAFYLLAHALFKSGLFMTAGAVTQATGEKELSKLGGLASTHPWLAAGSGVLAAALGALPLTIGFFKDELLFKAAHARGQFFAALAILGAGLSLAYIWRLWHGVFLGEKKGAPQHLPRSVVLPIVALGALVLIGGIWTLPSDWLVEAAAATIWGGPVPIEVAYHLDARVENLLAVATYVAGLTLIFLEPRLRVRLDQLTSLGQRAGPARWYQEALTALRASSQRILAWETRDLRDRVATVLLPTAVLVALSLMVAAPHNSYRFGEIDFSDLPLILGLLLAGGSAVATVRPHNHLTLVLALSTVGYSLAALYAFFSAPDVALVMVLVETILTMVFLAVYLLFPADLLDREEGRRASLARRVRDWMVGLVAGSLVLIVAWGALSLPPSGPAVAAKQLDLTPEVHAGDVVTAILADFRGLDTMGEITVVGIALLGITALVREGGFKR